MHRRTVLLTALALATALPLQAQDQPILVQNAYARSNGTAGGAGAVFLILQNTGTADDRLLSVTTDAAQMAELHSHTQDANGVMTMGAIEGGIALPAGASHALARGGDHIMLMGLTRALDQGDNVDLTLTFEKAGTLTITVPVDNNR
jgi:periplasmic copper chaperone A